MKKQITGIILTVTVILSIFSIPIYANTTLKLNWKTATIGLNEEYRFISTTNSSEEIKWTSSDNSIATVDKTGLVKGLMEGKVTISATVNSISTSVAVTVKKAPQDVFAEDLTVYIGSTSKIKITLPKGTASKGNTFKSSNTKIAKVDSKGVVTGIKEGVCKIKVTTFNGKSMTIDVTVEQVKYGNTALNCFQSHSYGNNFIQQDDLIFFTDDNLYRINADGSDLLVLDSSVVIDFFNSTDFYDVNVIDEWVYYRIDEDIYKIRTDGTDKTLILKSNNKVKTNKIYAVVGDWIYYGTNESTTTNSKGVLWTKKNSICKIRTDGTDNTIVVYDMATTGLNRAGNGVMSFKNLNIVDGWIYYIAERASYGLDNDGFQKHIADLAYIYKVRTDGTEKTELLEITKNSYPQALYVDSDSIYFTTINHCGLYKANIDGTQLDKIYDPDKNSPYFYGSTFNYKDGWFYFFEFDSYKCKMVIYKIRSDGTKKSKVFDFSVKGYNETWSGLSISGEWIYYYFFGDTSYYDYYRVSIDGKRSQKLDWTK